MDFLQNTLNWVKGEMFEASVIFLVGIFIMVSAISFWQFGTTPYSKALVIPLAITGLIFCGVGASGYLSNQKRLTEYPTQYEKNHTEFIQSEKQRVEGFQYMYKVSLAVFGVSALVVLIAFLFTENKTFQSIAIALMIIGSSLVVIDFFSKERATIYYGQINEELSMTNEQ